MAVPGPFAAFQTQAVRNTMDDESIVNGLWFGALASYFRYPDYIIAPEFWSSNSRRGDLFVIPAGTKKPVFAFEGKPPVGDSKWDQAGAQLLGYLKDITPIGGGSYGLLAAGTEFAIYHYNGSLTFSVTLDSDGDLKDLEKGDRIFNVATYADIVDGHRILTLIRGKFG